eukprot:COSAG02_NODE_5073_length_4666_cov_2.625137_7_plen_94_part_00
MAGKRLGYNNKRNISAPMQIRLCKKLVDETWPDPAFLKEHQLVCGDDKRWVFAHQRKLIEDIIGVSALTVTRLSRRPKRYRRTLPTRSISCAG